MQARAPLTPTVTAVGSGAPITAKYTSAAAANATKQRLRELETLLEQRINNIREDEIRNALLARFNQDKNLIGNAGVDRLNDARDKDLLDPTGEKNKGLNDRQTATQRQFTTKLQNHAEENNVIPVLNEMAEVRAGLFQKHLDEIDRKSNEKAITEFEKYMGKTTGDEVVGRDPSQPLPPIKTLRERLGSTSTVNHATNSNIKVEFQPDGNSAKSEDPKALALGMVADGKKSIVFGGHPRKALAAAQAALDAGAEDVDLEDNTKNSMYVSSGLFDNFQEAKDLRDQYDRLRQRVEAMKFARLNAATPVFNEGVSKAREHAVVFSKLTTPQAHLEYLLTLSVPERANLALELKRLNEGSGNDTPYQLGGVKLDEFNYISGVLAVNGPQWAQGRSWEFQQEYGKIQSDPTQLAAFRALTSPEDAAKFIANIKTKEARFLFYAEIEKMTAPAGNPGFKNDVRAACLAALVERRFKLASNDPKSSRENYKLTAASADPAEVNEILRGRSQADINHIQARYEQFYNRLGPKVARFSEINRTYTPPGRVGPRHVTYNSADGKLELPTENINVFYAQEEFSNAPNTTPRSRSLNNQEEVSRYLSFAKIVSGRVEHLRTHHQDVLPAKAAAPAPNIALSPASIPGGGPGRGRP